MGNIPNTNTPNLVLQSVGNGSNDSRWGTSGGGSGITQLTGDVTAGPGSGSVAATVAKINGSPLGTTTGATNGYVLTWNSTSGTWVPAASAGGPPSGTAGGDLSGTYPNPTVAKINGTALGTLTSAVNGNALIWSAPLNSWIPADPTFGGYTVNMGSLSPTTDDGSIPYFSNVGAVNQFIPGPVPKLTGHYYSWNTGLGGHWEILLANPGGALSNQGWTSTSIIPSSGTLPITSAGKIVEVTGITGFSSYLIGFNITATNGDATTGRNLNAYIYQGSSAVSQQRQYMVNNQTGSTSVSYIASGLTSGTSYSFAGYAFQGGSTTGTVLFATITVLGIA